MNALQFPSFISHQKLILGLLALSPFAILTNPANALSLEFGSPEIVTRSFNRFPGPDRPSGDETYDFNLAGGGFFNPEVRARSFVLSGDAGGAGQTVVRIEQRVPVTVVAGGGFKDGDIVEAFLEGTLRGFLDAEGPGSFAEISALSTIRRGTTSDDFRFDRTATSSAPFSLVNVNYFVPTELTVGQTYDLNTRLDAFARISGRNAFAQADFFTPGFIAPLGLTANVRPVSTRPVPGPLPVLGLGQTFLFSRRLRKKIKERTNTQLLQG